MTTSIQGLAAVFQLNSRLFINALEGISEDQAAARLSGHNNPIIWIAAHTVWARYLILSMLGKPDEHNPYAGMFENFKAYTDDMQLPSLEQVKTEWDKTVTLLNEALETVTEAHLAADTPLKSPTGVFTMLGTAAFLAQHESYDIGQLGFLKKLYTQEAMKYG